MPYLNQTTTQQLETIIKLYHLQLPDLITLRKPKDGVECFRGNTPIHVPRNWSLLISGLRSKRQKSFMTVTEYPRRYIQSQTGPGL